MNSHETDMSINVAPAMELDLQSLKRQLKQLKELHDSGALSSTSFEEGRLNLERRILDFVLSDAPLTPRQQTQQDPALQAGLGGISKPPLKLLGILAALVVAVAAGGYAWIGTSNVTASGESGNGPSSGADKAHSTNFDQIAAMTEKLAARLVDNPKDSEGWAMLARSYTVLGRNVEALDAFAKANALRGNDAVLLADYADALALKNGKNLSGEPMKMVEQALKLDPQNVKALSLAGTHAFESKNYASAVKYWEQVVQIGPMSNPLVEQVLPGLAQARELAGLPPGKLMTLAAPASPPLAALAGKTVSGTITLAPALAGQAKPDDTLFVIARPADGSRMPLAILQRLVKDLPLQFTLDDSMAMSPDASISKASQVTIVARISKSGNAMPEKGDLSGQSSAIAVGSKGVAVEISELVKK